MEKQELLPSNRQQQEEIAQFLGSHLAQSMKHGGNISINVNIDNSVHNHYNINNHSRQHRPTRQHRQHRPIGTMARPQAPIGVRSSSRNAVPALPHYENMQYEAEVVNEQVPVQAKSGGWFGLFILAVVLGCLFIFFTK